jgi:hypothetical protein
MRRLTIEAVAVVMALALPGAIRAQAPSDEIPVCRATLNGTELTTLVQFRDGYTVEGPWHVTTPQTASLADGGAGVAFGATLDRIVEVDPVSGKRESTPFPSPLEVTFEGHDRDELISRAAQVWCLSVWKARQESPKPVLSDRNLSKTAL